MELVAALVAAAVGVQLVSVPQPKLVHGFSPNFHNMLTSRGSRADWDLGGILHGNTLYTRQMFGS